MTYKMTTIYNDTRIRSDHSTAAAIVFPNVPAGVTVTGDELYTATATLPYQNLGDKWLRVSYVANGITYTGWMAYIHKGQNICRDLQEVDITPPVSEWPEYFYLEDPQGKRVKYVIS